jgi:hypothetical protein
METTTLLYLIIGLLTISFITVIYLFMRRKPLEIIKEIISAPEIIIRTIEQCKLGYKLEGTECKFLECPIPGTDGIPYYNDTVNKECKKYSQAIWNEFNVKKSNICYKNVTLNPSTDKVDWEYDNGINCTNLNKCVSGSTCLNGSCQGGTTKVCKFGFNCIGGICQVNNGRCPSGYKKYINTADDTQNECKLCSINEGGILANLENTACLSYDPYVPEALPFGFDSTLYYAEPVGTTGVYQLKRRTRTFTIADTNFGCKVLRYNTNSDSYYTDDTLTENKKDSPCYDNDPCTTSFCDSTGNGNCVVTQTIAFGYHPVPGQTCMTSPSETVPTVDKTGYVSCNNECKSDDTKCKNLGSFSGDALINYGLQCLSRDRYDNPL